MLTAKEEKLKADNALYLPAEWEEQSGVEIIWPGAGTDWKDNLKEVTETYLYFAESIAKREKLLIITSERELTEQWIKKRIPDETAGNITLLECHINDTWARDSGFISLVNKNSGKIDLLDFRFNGWGNKFAAEKDNIINKKIYFSGLVNGEYRDCNDFILEGGSIETDGKKILLTTESCLLSPTRNPKYDKAAIEYILKSRLHVNKVCWLAHGELTGDDTDGHIDMLARFCPGEKIVYVKCTDPKDPQYSALKLMEEDIFKIAEETGKTPVALHLPEAVYNERGNRLPATYANFLVINGAILCPAYDQPDRDAEAMKIIGKLFPGRETLSIPSLPLIKQGGAIHCSTMQYPYGMI